MTLIINLYAGPGAGKSTTAAGVFHELKKLDINCELVTEFVKDKKWENNDKIFQAQPYIFGKQYWKLFRCLDEVDVVVTDSPLLTQIVYNNKYAHIPHFNDLVLELNKQFSALHYYITRTKTYNPKGRNETLEQAIDLDLDVLNMLNDTKTLFKTLNYDIAVDNIVRDITGGPLECLN